MSLAAALLVLSVCSLAHAGSSTLTSRQAFNIPSSCILTCASVTDILFTPQDCNLIPELCCPAEEMLQLVSCYRCINDDAVSSTGKSLDNTRNQGIVDGLINSCDARGYKLFLTMPQITLPGQDPYRPGVHITDIILSSSGFHYMPTTSSIPPHISSTIPYLPIYTTTTSPYHTPTTNPPSIPITGFTSPSTTTVNINPNRQNTNTGAARRIGVSLGQVYIVPAMAISAMVYINF